MSQITRCYTEFGKVAEQTQKALISLCQKFRGNIIYTFENNSAYTPIYALLYNEELSQTIEKRIYAIWIYEDDICVFVDEDNKEFTCEEIEENAEDHVYTLFGGYLRGWFTACNIAEYIDEYIHSSLNKSKYYTLINSGIEIGRYSTLEKAVLRAELLSKCQAEESERNGEKICIDVDIKNTLNEVVWSGCSNWTGQSGQYVSPDYIDPIADNPKMHFVWHSETETSDPFMSEEECRADIRRLIRKGIDEEFYIYCYDSNKINDNDVEIDDCTYLGYMCKADKEL